MNTLYIRTTALLVTLSMLLQGCASTADGRATQGQGAALGAVGGALLGGALGALRGGGIQGIAQGAVAGAAVGGAAGFAYGSMVAKRKATYARAEDWLNQEIALAKEADSKAYAYNASLKQKVAALDRRASVAKAKGNKAALNQIKAELQIINTESANQAKIEAQNEADSKAVLGDPAAQKAANFQQYRQAAAAYSSRKAERGQIMDRVSVLENSIGA